MHSLSVEGGKADGARTLIKIYIHTYIHTYIYIYIHVYIYIYICADVYARTI
jgi:hypothetical protein